MPAHSSAAVGDLQQSKTDVVFLPPFVRAALPYFILALIGFAVYGNCFNNLFVFDDQLLIQRNLFIRDSHLYELLTSPTNAGAFAPGGLFRPLQMLLFWVVYHGFGPDEAGFHVLSIALHAANACLVYGLGRALGFGARGVFAAALLWAVHPIHTEAVAYISGTADPLVMFCMLSGLLILLPDAAPRRVAGALVFGLLSLASKESGVAFPLLACLCLLVKTPRLADGVRLCARTAPLWAAAAGFAVWRVQAPGFFGASEVAALSALPDYAFIPQYLAHFSIRLNTFLATIPAYAGLLVWPSPLFIERDFYLFPEFFVGPVLAGAAFLAVAAVLVSMGLRDRRVMPLSFACLWFFAAHGPNSGLAMPLNSLFLEHWMYVPLAGFLLGLCEQVGRLLASAGRGLRVAAAVVVVGVAVAMGARTLEQNLVWRTPETLYTHIIRYNERSARAQANLGNYYFTHAAYDRAFAQYAKAVSIFDGDPVVRYSMAVAYANALGGSLELAEASALRALELKPDFAHPYFILGDIYERRGEAQKAAEARRKGESLLRQSGVR